MQSQYLQRRRLCIAAEATDRVDQPATPSHPANVPVASSPMAMTQNTSSVDTASVIPPSLESSTPLVDTAVVVQSSSHSQLVAQRISQRVEFGQLLNESVTRMKRTPIKCRAVQHAAIVRSSPYKTALETSKANCTGTKKPIVAGQGSRNQLIQLRWVTASCKWSKQHASLTKKDPSWTVKKPKIYNAVNDHAAETVVPVFHKSHEYCKAFHSLKGGGFSVVPADQPMHLDNELNLN